MSESNAAAPAASAPIESSPSSQESSVENKDSLQAEAASQIDAVDEAHEILDDPNASKKEKEQAKKLIKKYSLKVDGKEEEVELDLSNDEEVKKYLQKAKASDKRFKESAEIRKAALDFIDELRKNPKKILSDPNIGIDVKQLAREIMNEELAEAEKSPEQREKERLTKELEELKERYRKDEEKRKQDEFERLQAEQEQKLESDISHALDTGGLPKTPYTVKKMAETMMLALQHDIDLSPQDVVPLIRKQMQAEIKEMLSASSDDVLEEFLKDQMPRLRKRNVAKAKAAIETANSVKPTLAPKKEESSKEIKKITMKDFLKSKR